MEIITLRAHFDGTQIQLDEPFELQPDTKLLVTVIPSPDSEKEDWRRLTIQGLEAAYGNNEPEYPLSLIKEQNADYERG